MQIPSAFSSARIASITKIPPTKIKHRKIRISITNWRNLETPVFAVHAACRGCGVVMATRWRFLGTRGSGWDSGSFKRRVYNQLHRKQTSSEMLEARTWNQQSVSLIATSLLTKEYTSVCGNLIMGIRGGWYLVWGCRCYLCSNVMRLGDSCTDQNFWLSDATTTEKEHTKVFYSI